MSFTGMLTERVNIRRQSVTPDDDGAPVATWPVAYANVRCWTEDKRPKLHGNQFPLFDQMVVGIAHEIYVEGLYPVPASGNGWAIEFDIPASGGTGTFARVTSSQRFRGKGSIRPYMIFVCEETGG